MASRVAVAVCSAAALAVAYALARDAPLEWERSVTRRLAALPDALAPPLWVAMQAGTRWAIVVAVAVLLVVRRQWTAVMVGAAGVFAWGLATVLKGLAERPRPTASAVGASLRDHVDGHGFPSSHAAIAAALATALVLCLRPPAWLSAVLIGCAVCTALARVYFGVHWPLDVVGGAAVGVFAGSTVAALGPSR